MEKEIVVDETSFESEKVFKRNKWFFTIPGIGRDMLYTLVSTYFLQYVQFGVTLSVAQFATLSLLIGILGRVWDGINDPMMGAIIDGSHMKWGKFKPWIFIGALIDGILTIVLFTLRFNGTPEQTGWIYVAIICLVYLLWEAAFTMNDIGYWSMIPSLSRSKDRRDSLTSLTVFFAGIGTIIMTALVTFFTPGNVVDSYAIYSVIACLGVIGGQTVTAFGVKEAPLEEKDKEKKISFKHMVKTIINNKQLLWISLALLCSSAATGIILGLIYNLYYLECGYDGDILFFVIIYAVCNTLLQIAYPKLAGKYGRQKVQDVSIIIMACGFIGMCLIGWFEFLPISIVTICIFALLIFGGNTLFYTAEVINLNNCVEYNEYITGERDEAVVTTMRPLIVKFGDAIKYGVVALTLIASGIYSITQNISAIETQTSMFDKKVETVEQAQEYVRVFEEVSYLVNNNGTVEEIANKVSSSEVLSSCQFDYSYTNAVGEMYMTRTSNDDANDTVVLGRLVDISETDIVSGYTYKLVISTDKEHNAANKIYSEKKDFSTRLIIRIACCLVPGILMVLCWLIQKKKFIINEEYFNKITEEIANRKTK